MPSLLPRAGCLGLVLMCVVELGSPGAAERTLPPALHGLPVPAPDNLADFVADQAAAVRLGKALFWDSQLAGDGEGACASCHYKAGADERIKNTLGPGGTNVVGARFDASHGGAPNYTLKLDDFPFRRLSNPADRHSAVLFDTDDVVTSQGVFTEWFRDLVPGAAQEKGRLLSDLLFDLHGVAIRRTGARQAPPAVNAVFNYRQRWDGRSTYLYNGVNPLGEGTGAVVFRSTPDGSLQTVTIALDFASLASQTMGPYLNTNELAYIDRPLVVLGRKTLSLRPLARQRVDPADSVLGNLLAPGGKGLRFSYPELIQAAIRPEWWQSTAILVRTADGTFAAASRPLRPLRPNEFTLMEANFPLILGLSVQAYLSTLVSDQAPYDLYRAGDQNALTPAQKRGLNLFATKARCLDCHDGPLFSTATVPYLFPEGQSPRRIEYTTTADGSVALHDTGYYNLGVRPSAEDLCLGSTDPYGRPLSLARRVVTGVGAGDLGGDLPAPPAPGQRVADRGAFKVPILRNVELTGPYFHNGGQATLEQVVQFFNRGGDFQDVNPEDAADLKELHLTGQEQSDLVAFLKALTDPRVAREQAPFDHPELSIPHGHLGGVHCVMPTLSGRAVTLFERIPAVGRDGGDPLPPFADQASGKLLSEAP